MVFEEGQERVYKFEEGTKKRAWSANKGAERRREKERWFKRVDQKKKRERRGRRKETGIERPNLKEWEHNSEGAWARKAGSANSRNRFRHVADHPGTVLINK